MPHPTETTAEAIGRRRMRRSDRLLRSLAGFERLLVVTHDTPDPDTIASGWVIWLILRERLARPVRLVGRGAILRAENRHLVDLLKPPLEMVHDLEVPPGTGAVLVDCSPRSGNHLLDDEGVIPAAVIDHHTDPGRRRRTRFEDVRPRVIASASIAVSYLREQQLEPGRPLATALLYAIRTEARGAETAYSWLDRSSTLWLSQRADFSLLSEIEDAPLSPAYFGDLVLAFQNTMLYGEDAFCLLPRANYPEIVGEVADMLIRCEGVRRVLCGAVSGEDLCVSVRTKTAEDHATHLVRATLAGLGHGGGHHRRAGGKIRGVAHNAKNVRHIQDELRCRWLAVCGVAQQPGTRLIPRREIIKNL
jgi:nanoRNase/pAp phosphatase (c-di-AMP/oligoRNAs hydrolase)